MNLILTRINRRPDGIFGELRDEAGKLLAVTLEHAYPRIVVAEAKCEYDAKIPSGTFRCVRGYHRLHGMTEDFETFEITGVKDHSNLLFHWGNYGHDSDGCVLLGAKVALGGVPSSIQMITNSRTTFAGFMASQEGVDEFQLTVKG